jgi:hypothetical protein
MKKILITVMSCSDNFFEQQVNQIKETWAIDVINNKYENIDFIYYRGDENINSNVIYNESKKELILRCEDDLDNTFKKTVYAFDWISENKEYDYIFRTNTSTYVNIELLNAFIQSLDDDNITYTSELYSLIEANTPKPMYIYGRGNGLIISKKMINVIRNDGINLLYFNITDDIAIGNILNSYWIKQNKNYLDYIKSYTHGWFKAVKHTMFVGGKPDYLLCTFDNKNTDFEFLKKFITIQTKMYYSRNLEEENYNELHNIIYNNVDKDIENTIQFINNYSNNPNIFIGSIIGYIPLSEWKEIPREKMWYAQAYNKADNDIYKDVFKNKKLL